MIKNLVQLGRHLPSITASILAFSLCEVASTSFQEPNQEKGPESSPSSRSSHRLNNDKFKNDSFLNASTRRDSPPTKNDAKIQRPPVANSDTSTFRIRRLTMASDKQNSGGNFNDHNGRSSAEKKEGVGETAETDNEIRSGKQSVGSHLVSQNQGDTFLYLNEMENIHKLDCRNYNVISLHQSGRANETMSRIPRDFSEEQIQASHEYPLLPFSNDVLGAYSCHGIEELSMGRLLHRLQHEDATRKDLADNPPVVAKPNQDRGCVAHPYGNDARTALFAVFDGHGTHGEEVADYAMRHIMLNLRTHPDFVDNVEHAMGDTLRNLNRYLKKNDDVQSTYSGSTACVILMRDGTLHVMNLGDSRAVLGRKEKRVVLDDVDDTKVHNLYTAVDLTWDQCPDLPSERERIERRGGYVSQGTVAYQDASDYTVDTSNDSSSPSRVWLDSDYQQIGLAMSRSIGDLALQKVGVSSHPVVSTYQLVDGDDFIIIASDGVWQFISSSQAVDIVGTCFDNGQNAMETCKILIEKSVEQWRSREGDYRDDITAIVIRLKDLWRCQGGGRRRCSKE